MISKVTIDKKKISEVLTIKQNTLNKKVIEKILKNIVGRVEDSQLYKESAWVATEYNHLQHSLDALYSFIYTPDQSNLSLKDAEVFASYAVQQCKKLKDIVRILSDNRVNTSPKKSLL